MLKSTTKEVERMIESVVFDKICNHTKCLHGEDNSAVCKYCKKEDFIHNMFQVYDNEYGFRYAHRSCLNTRGLLNHRSGKDRRKK